MREPHGRARRRHSRVHTKAVPVLHCQSGRFVRRSYSPFSAGFLDTTRRTLRHPREPVQILAAAKPSGMTQPAARRDPLIRGPSDSRPARLPLCRRSHSGVAARAVRPCNPPAGTNRTPDGQSRWPEGALVLVPLRWLSEKIWPVALLGFPSFSPRFRKLTLDVGTTNPTPHSRGGFGEMSNLRHDGRQVRYSLLPVPCYERRSVRSRMVHQLDTHPRL